MCESLARNLKVASRQLFHYPGATAAIVFTLALAIGANTAIFSIVNALILKQLPYPDPERIGTVYVRTTGTAPFDGPTGIDGERWELLRAGAPSLISAVTGGFSGVNFRSGSRVQFVHDGRISAHYLDVLGLKPILGRNFTEAEDAPNSPGTAILSYEFWNAAFGADPNILGTSIHLKGGLYTVIGVLPRGATTPLAADVYTALQPSRQGEGVGTNFELITRLRDGATWQRADAEINRAWAARADRYAKNNPGSHIAYYSVPLQQGETDSLRPQLMALMVATGFILLIACANLAGLTLVRMLRRRREIATRLALGASHGQVLGLVWTENLLLALLGGAAAIGAGFLALRGLLLLLPKHFLPVESVPLDGRVLGFTLLLALVASIFFGMLPALSVRRVDLRSAMGGHTANAAGGPLLRQVLTAGEVALTLILLAAAGLVIRTLIHLETLPPGFNPVGVMSAKASLDDVRYHDPAAFRRLLDESTAAMRKIQGVQDAAVGLTLPYERALNDSVTLSDGILAGKQVGADELYVTPGYFHTLQMPVLAGRAFSDGDSPTAQPVAIVNQSFARKLLQTANPVGRYLNKNTRIVGMVADMALSTGLTSNAAPLTTEQTIYFPAAQFGDARTLVLVHTWFQPSWVVRTAAPLPGLTAQMQQALSAADPSLPFSGFYGMSDLMAGTLSTQRIEVTLLSVMAGLALLLSALGIFALVANLVVQRTREIGIRMALGSTTWQAMVEIGKSGALALAVGLAAGLILCTATLPIMRSVLYGVHVFDTTSLLAVVLTLVLVTFSAIAIPAFRISGIDPAGTLREE